MDEYITKSDAINIIKQRQDYLSSCDCWAIMNMPAADVIPVRYGRWEKVTSLMHQFGYYLGASCSICGKTHYFSSGEILSNYCPNCGAKMDL